MSTPYDPSAGGSESRRHFLVAGAWFASNALRLPWRAAPGGRLDGLRHHHRAVVHCIYDEFGRVTDEVILLAGKESLPVKGPSRAG